MTIPKKTPEKPPKSKPLKKKKAMDKVVSVAKTAQKSKKVKFSKSEQAILSELEHLAGYIQDAKAEIGLIRPDDVKHNYLPDAKDELDAVVEAAADATNAIMDSCEIIEDVMTAVPQDSSDKLMDATTRIYEACSFQDITGQRINKVVKTMKHIEERIDALMDAFGDGIGKVSKSAKTDTVSASDASNGPVTDEDLLEGPQLGEKAKNQAEIDDLLASFD